MATTIVPQWRARFKLRTTAAAVNCVCLPASVGVPALCQVRSMAYTSSACAANRPLRTRGFLIVLARIVGAAEWVRLAFEREEHEEQIIGVDHTVRLLRGYVGARKMGRIRTLLPSEMDGEGIVDVCRALGPSQ